MRVMEALCPRVFGMLTVSSFPWRWWTGITQYSSPGRGTEQNGFLIKDLRTERMRGSDSKGTGNTAGLVWVNGWMVAPIPEKRPEGEREASLGGRC